MARASGEVMVRDRSGAQAEFRITELVDRMEGLREMTHALESPAVARFALREWPVRYRKAVIGFYEERGPKVSGMLRLEEQVIRFTETAGKAHEWRLLDLTAVHTASAAIQISPLGGGLVSFHLPDDSPRRWEDELKWRIRLLWEGEGRGEIREFQPRIRAV